MEPLFFPWEICVMPQIGSVEYKYLSDFINTDCKTSNSLIDMQGYDWSQKDKRRFKYLGGYHSGIDFSGSKSETGFVVRKAVFEKCIFDHSIWWLAEFHSCTFIDCSFDYGRFYNSGLRGRFFNCSFRCISSRGEYFTFAWGSVYENCIFESIDLRNVDDALGVRFEDCKIDGIMKNTFPCTFYGRRYALNKRFQSMRNVFCSVYRPVTFIRCDLTNLQTKNIIFEKDIVYKDTKGQPIVINDL